MKKQMRKAFTLVELMVVIMIVAILAAVLVPTIRGRVNRAKWSEGMAGAGTVATALRAYCVEQGAAPSVPLTDLTIIGLSTFDLQGKYFSSTNYSVQTCTFNSSTGEIHYSIQVTPGTGVDGTNVTLNEVGAFAGVP